MASIIFRKNRWYVKFKDSTGSWVRKKTPYTSLDDKPQVEQLAKKTDEKVKAIVDLQQANPGEIPKGPLTVAMWSVVWLKGREETVRDIENERRRIRLHILPLIGDLLLAEVRPRHLIDAVMVWRKFQSPSSVYHNYSTCRTMFRNAAIRDLIVSNPCILDKQYLGPLKDSKGFNRDQAVFSAEEIALLISNPSIPLDRQALYALISLAGLRPGEAMGLTWNKIDPSAVPLPRITISTSYNNRPTKNDCVRYVPMHPLLQERLGQWLLTWEKHVGRQPTLNDFVVPTHTGTCRHAPRVWERLQDDLGALGIRSRRVYDFRRTFISLCLAGGANPHLLTFISHNPQKTTVLNMYTTIPWATLCAQVLALDLPLASSPSLGPWLGPR